MLTWLYGAFAFAVIFVIIFNLLSPRNNARRGLFLCIAGVCSGVIFLIIYSLDLRTGIILPEGDDPSLYYFNYFAPGILLTVAFLISGFVMFLIGKKNGCRVSVGGREYTKEVNQYLFVLYHYNGMYYLKREKNSTFSAVCEKFYKSITYYDDMVNKFVLKNGLDVASTTLVGTATNYSSKKTIYYCFSFELSSSKGLEEYEAVDPFRIANVEMKDFHKALTLKILLKDNFNIEI